MTSVSERVGVGSLWKRRAGREVVRVERVWEYRGETLVRAHPTHGGRPIVASTDDLRAIYAPYPPAVPAGGAGGERS